MIDDVAWRADAPVRAPTADHLEAEQQPGAAHARRGRHAAAASAANRSRKYSPVRDAFAISCSRSSTSSTASPAAAATALPPKVEKKPILRLKGLDQRAVGDYDPHRIAVAHGLSQRHDVRLEAAAREPPEVRTGAAEPVLHLVGDDECAGGAYARRDRGAPRRAADRKCRSWSMRNR